MSTHQFPPPWLADAASQASPVTDAVRVDGEGAGRRLVAARDLAARTAYLAPALAVGTRAGLVRAVGDDEELWGRVLAAVAADDADASAADPPFWSLALPAGLTGSAARPDAAWCLPPAEVAAARHAEGAAAACVAVSLDGGQSAPSAVCLFVSRDVAAGDEVTLDWAPAGPRSVQRAAAVLARLPAARWAAAAERAALAAAVAAAAAKPLPGVAPAATPPRSDAAPPPAEAKPPVSVWTDYPLVGECLNEASLFTRTADRAAAAIVVSPHPIRHDAGCTQRSNQFPYEAALIRKDLLPATLRGWWARQGDEARARLHKLVGAAADAAHPPFFPPAYDLASEAHWALAAAAAADADPGAAWVVKPATASRAVGITATRLPATLAAFRAAAGGDRVMQRCIARPATYQGRKFDLRVVVAVRSFTPPDAVLYTGWHARVAPKAHDAAAVTERGSLVTVSCYDDEEEGGSDGHASQLMLPRRDVDAALEQRGWSPPALAAAIAALAAGVVQAGGGAIGTWPRSGAWYGLDVMLDEGAVVDDDGGASFPAPRLLEVNFAPDLTTAATFRPALPGELLAAVFGGASVGAGLDGDAWRKLF